MKATTAESEQEQFVTRLIFSRQPVVTVTDILSQTCSNETAECSINEALRADA